jgi:formylglycine-generating enzyme required for sulfatase activity
MAAMRLTSWIAVFSLLAMLSVNACPYAVMAAEAIQRAAKVKMVTIPAGPFIMGSTHAEREYGYRLDETLHGSHVARQYGWFEHETRRVVTLPAYRIDIYPVTNADYLHFIKATGRLAPFVTQPVWQRYRLIHKYATVQRFLWVADKPPQSRLTHPVVLVSQANAAAYCQWYGATLGYPLRLPTEAQWEKAARGTKGAYFPWGDSFDPNLLNSYDNGPFDTVPVGQYPLGKSPYGALDMAGQVFEWTSTAWKDPRLKFVVKGGSWDDLPGVTRSAARHGRPGDLKHILIGFRCVGPIID